MAYTSAKGEKDKSEKSRVTQSTMHDFYCDANNKIIDLSDVAGAPKRQIHRRWGSCDRLARFRDLDDKTPKVGMVPNLPRWSRFEALSIESRLAATSPAIQRRRSTTSSPSTVFAPSPLSPYAAAQTFSSEVPGVSKVIGGSVVSSGIRRCSSSFDLMQEKQRTMSLRSFIYRPSNHGRTLSSASKIAWDPPCMAPCFPKSVHRDEAQHRPWNWNLGAKFNANPVIAYPHGWREVLRCVKQPELRTVYAVPGPDEVVEWAEHPYYFLQRQQSLEVDEDDVSRLHWYTLYMQDRDTSWARLDEERMYQEVCKVNTADTRCPTGAIDADSPARETLREKVDCVRERYRKESEEKIKKQMEENGLPLIEIAAVLERIRKDQKREVSEVPVHARPQEAVLEVASPPSYAIEASDRAAQSKDDKQSSKRKRAESPSSIKSKIPKTSRSRRKSTFNAIRNFFRRFSKVYSRDKQPQQGDVLPEQTLCAGLIEVLANSERLPGIICQQTNEECKAIREQQRLRAAMSKSAPRLDRNRSQKQH